MKPCYFCHLPVGDQLTAEILINYQASIHGGQAHTERHAAHIACCELARQIIEDADVPRPLKAFPFTFKP